MVGGWSGLNTVMARLDAQVGTDMTADLLAYSEFTDSNKVPKMHTHLPELYRLLTIV